MVLTAKNTAKEARYYRIFDEEFLPHIDALFNFALRLTSNEEDANDLVQEAYLKAFRFIESYEVGTNAKAWLFRILKNVFINEFRRRKKLPNQIDIDTLKNGDIEEDTGFTPKNDLRVEMFDQLMGDEVTIAINDLPINFRVVLLLCDIEEFSYEETALIINAPVGTVRSRLHRARNLLKDKLRSHALSLGFQDKRS